MTVGIKVALTKEMRRDVLREVIFFDNLFDFRWYFIVILSACFN